MQLVYTSVDNATIQATLDAGETLGHVSGPGVVYAPVDAANAEYQAILASGDPIAPFVPPPPPEPAPVSLPPVMPSQPNDATPKVYVDQEIATVKAEISPLTSRVEALERIVAAAGAAASAQRRTK